MGLNSRGQQISKGNMSTRNLAFNYSFDINPENAIIPADQSFEKYLELRGLSLDPTTNFLVARSILPESIPATDSLPF
jgi:hypothetical protein